MKTKRLIAKACGLVVMLFHSMLWSFTPSLRIDPSLRVDPAQISFSDRGKKDTVEIWVDDIANLGAFQFDLLYDPAVAHAQSVGLGKFLGSTGRAAFSLSPQIDSTRGRLTFGAFSTGGQAGPAGSGILATVIFDAQAKGATALRLQNVKISDIRGNAIATARLEPSQIFSNNAGEKFTVELWLDNAANLQFFQFDLAFDTTTVNAQSAALDEFLTRTGRTAVPNGPIIDNNHGRLSFGATSSGTNSGPAGTGVLATIIFQSRAPGMAMLKFQSLIVSVAEKQTPVDKTPHEFQLEQNYPNPFNSTTRLVYQLPKPVKLNVRITNILGQTIRTLVDEEKPAGIHETIWDGRDSQGKNVAGGIYWARLEAGDFVQTRKMIYVP